MTQPLAMAPQPMTSTCAAPSWLAPVATAPAVRPPDPARVAPAPAPPAASGVGPAWHAARAFLVAALPIRRWFHASVLRSWTLLGFAAAVAYPLVASWLYAEQFLPVSLNADGSLNPQGQAALTHDLDWLDWPCVVYFGALWIFALWRLIRPRVRFGQVGSIVVVGLIIQAPMAIWLETVFPSGTSNPLTAIGVVGGSEELAKLVTVLVALVIAVQFTRSGAATWGAVSPRSYAFLGALSGIIFGCSEAVTYIVNSQFDTINGTDSVIQFTSQYFFRLIQDPIAHAMWAGICCYFLGIAVQRARRAGRPLLAGLVDNWSLPAAGLAIAAVLHGLNDWVSPVPLLQAAIDAISILLLICYVRCGDQIADALAGRPGSRWTYRVGDAVLIPTGWQLPIRAGGKTLRWTQHRRALAGRVATVVWIEPDRLARLDVDGAAQAWPVDWLDPLPAARQVVHIPTATDLPRDADAQVASWTAEMDVMRGTRAAVIQVFADATVMLDHGPSNIRWASRWLQRAEGSYSPGAGDANMQARAGR